MTRTFETVGVVGLGTMGAGIAEVFARAEMSVIGVEADEAALERGRRHLETSTARAVARDRMSAEQQSALLGRITFTTSREDLADVDLVVEAIPELMEYKRGLFSDLDRICKPSAVLATNTSSLSVTAIAATTSRPAQVVGMHFFNPAPVMRLVEVIGTVVTEDGLAGEIADLARRLGKTPVTVGDRAGFVVNRLLLGYLNHACGLLESGLASRDDIDAAMKLGLGLPMGPFTLLDLIGLDTSYEVCEVLFRESRDPRHAPAPVLREFVTAGLLGRKTGRGFYSYAEGAPTVPEPGPRAAVSMVGIVGSGPEVAGLVADLDAAGFKATVAERSDLTPVADADVVVALSDRPVVELAVRLSHPERLVGLHLVGDRVAEVASTVLTSEEVAGAVQDLVTVLRRTPVRCGDRAEMVVDALLYPYLNDAVRMVDSGYATAGDIDDAMRLGCGYPAGPFEMLDSIGLERVRDGLRALYAEYREPSFAPAPLLDQLVTAGVPGFRAYAR
ncbi:3-hydroxybutyryl-CoA dehydrogenase [Planotetraspora phitsanulokensis]|uniref:3-hydroxybutyryl-CoA dehydrogenase n=1 Tax=Planotetraspora phitsanulokensis TaxID=575192 RepID=A0A8J3U7Q4_9ACTN|nr:3-hydroxybutyryl-CoA dehydrogenase [Planotetraspora phitsanulokensis]GII38622.1 3-hydroxybutyryl-CoA dehydrogenase [Planotetraspora phitsanulokensis]